MALPAFLRFRGCHVFSTLSSANGYYSRLVSEESAFVRKTTQRNTQVGESYSGIEAYGAAQTRDGFHRDP